MSLDALNNEAHVWFVVPESIQDPALLSRFETLLGDEELHSYRRFRFRRHAHRHLVSHALLRDVLSRYVDKPPADWVFSSGPHGRPELAGPGDPMLRFNLTHTAGLAACIVTLQRDCGIDAEPIVRRRAVGGVARRMFSQRECARLDALPDDSRLVYFFQRWTLREAYGKARGVGLSFPTRKLAFDTADSCAVEAAFEPEIADDASRWQFELLNLSDQHVTAVAIGRARERSLKIVTHRYEP
jgi:4'-phosphopantetheinyl transferase